MIAEPGTISGSPHSGTRTGRTRSRRLDGGDKPATALDIVEVRPAVDLDAAVDWMDEADDAVTSGEREVIVAHVGERERIGALIDGQIVLTTKQNGALRRRPDSEHRATRRERKPELGLEQEELDELLAA